jgi:hypothetical protein
MKLKDIPPPTLITGVAAIAWLGSFGLRALNPSFALGPAADALMTTVVGWWFTENHKAGDGLLGSIVSKNVIPSIATAHAEPKPGQVTPPVYVPKPSPPKPTKPIKPGGLPWG